MIVIGLTGKAGAGKGVVADHLVAEHDFTKLSFAGPLKKMLRTLNPVISYPPDNDLGPETGDRLSVLLTHLTEAEIKTSPYGPEYRRLLQVLGTDCIRAVDEGFWVRAALAQLTDLDGRYVFDDVRFPNEAEAVQRALRTQAKTALWFIHRPEHDGGAGTHASEQHAGHMSENAVIHNDSTVDELKLVVDAFVRARAWFA